MSDSKFERSIDKMFQPVVPTSKTEDTVKSLAKIPTDFLSMTIDSYPGDVGLDDSQTERVERLRNAVKNYVLSMKKDTKIDSLFISGPPGVGKTFIASYCMTQAILAMYPRSLSNLFCTANDILISYNQGNKAEKRNAKYDIKQFETGVLCIDDFGREYLMTWKGVDRDLKQISFLLADLIKRRSEAGLVTYIASSVSLNDVKDDYGAELYDIINRSMRKFEIGEDFPNFKTLIAHKENKEFREKNKF